MAGLAAGIWASHSPTAGPWVARAIRVLVASLLHPPLRPITIEAGMSASVPVRPTVAAILVLALCHGSTSFVHAQSTVPKGRYTSLNALPDWGGAWFLDFSPPGGAQGSPKLKGKYLEAYQRWAQQVKTTDGEVARADSNCTPPGMPEKTFAGVGTMPPRRTMSQ